jgi:hypothetical protein
VNSDRKNDRLCEYELVSTKEAMQTWSPVEKSIRSTPTRRFFWLEKRAESPLPARTVSFVSLYRRISGAGVT